MLQRLTGFAFCLMVSFSLVWAEDTPVKVPGISLSAIDSVKNVHSLCLGYIDGRPSQVGQFKKELEKQLTLKGFKVVQDLKSCDATLVGVLQVNVQHEDPISALLSMSWITYPTWAYMKLINSNLNTVWKESYGPHGHLLMIWLPSNRGYVPTNGIVNRSIDIARGLAKARDKDSHL